MAVLPLVPEYKEESRTFEIIDYEKTAENTDMPEWVGRYINEGISGIEAMPEYENSYIFVGKQQGNNLDSLRLWARGFSIERDFSRLVAARIQVRFFNASAGNPADEFGHYFENVIKNISDAVFSGAEQEESFWVKKKIPQEGGLTPEGYIFEYYIPIHINKDALKKQINIILRTTRTDIPPTKEQASASSRLRIGFFNTF
jgi:hypothetical protein